MLHIVHRRLAGGLRCLGHAGFALRASAASALVLAPAAVAPVASAIAGRTVAVAAHAAVIAPGGAIQAAVDASPPGTTFLLSDGTYSGQSVVPKDGDRFFGQSKNTILDGAGTSYAFRGQGVSMVTIRGLTFRNYAPPNDIGVLGTDASSFGWTVQGSTFSRIRRGAALMLGNHMVVENSIFDHNDMAGVGGYKVHGAVVRGNDIHDNNQIHQNPFTPTSDVAGIKVATSFDVKILDNYVHDNPAAPAVWMDMGCSGTIVEGNRLERNGIGVVDELDYGATIANNTIAGNNLDLLDGFAGGGIYAFNSRNADIHDNIVVGNGGGIWVYQEERGAGARGKYVVSDDTVSNNLISLSLGETGFGGTTPAHAVKWLGNHYELTGSARLVAGGHPLSLTAWWDAGNDAPHPSLAAPVRGDRSAAGAAPQATFGAGRQENFSGR